MHDLHSWTVSEDIPSLNLHAGEVLVRHPSGRVTVHRVLTASALTLALALHPARLTPVAIAPDASTAAPHQTARPRPVLPLPRRSPRQSA